MLKSVNPNEEIFNTMHRLEQAGMSRDPAETTACAVDGQVTNGIQLVLEKLDEIKKGNIIANCIIGIGFAGIIVSLVGIMIALFLTN